jgi:putative transposase
MARRPRLEVEGGLYHLIARGNNRQNIFHSDDDHKKFLSLVGAQKEKLKFYLYSYCLMTNHVHLLIERQADPIGRIMHRVLTGYSQYYNRKYRKVGHVFQGRHRSILCQSDRYLAELVRYIHLNPVRAKMVRKAERYPHSSQRAYLGMEPAGAVDVDPVLRLFGARKRQARENFAQYVIAGMKLGHREEFYLTDEAGILGTEEFVDATIHRLGETDRRTRRYSKKEIPQFNADALIKAVEKVCQMPREDFCGPGKAMRALLAKEALIISGRQAGANLGTLSSITGLSSSTISKRYDAALRKMPWNGSLRKMTNEIIRIYHKH